MVGTELRRTCMVIALGASFALAGSGLDRPAQACGGTFCDAGPTAMPVEQTGETILFIVDGTHVEAHIQIEFDPETQAEEFAWVVPVTALPEFSVGSQPLFTSLLSASVPSYGISTWNEPCDVDDDELDNESCGDEAAGDEGDDENGPHLDIAGGAGPSEPEVVVATTVGAFEIFVLDGGTAQGVMQWLADEGFAQDEAAMPILEDYLAEDHLFVAMRLAVQAEASEIHPIILRYEGSEPCVPIRLTKIAAKEDLELRALFLGDYRYASSNYPHITLNPLKIDWSNSATNYGEVLSMAVDEAGTKGHAFVTEYAGPSAIVTAQGLAPRSGGSGLGSDEVSPGRVPARGGAAALRARARGLRPPSHRGLPGASSPDRGPDLPLPTRARRCPPRLAVLRSLRIRRSQPDFSRSSTAFDRPLLENWSFSGQRFDWARTLS